MKQDVYLLTQMGSLVKFSGYMQLNIHWVWPAASSSGSLYRSGSPSENVIIRVTKSNSKST